MVGLSVANLVLVIAELDVMQQLMPASLGEAVHILSGRNRPTAPEAGRFLSRSPHQLLLKKGKCQLRHTLWEAHSC